MSCVSMTEEITVLEDKKVRRQTIDSKGRFVKGCAPWNKGIHTGHTPWNKGTKGAYSPEYIKKLSESHKGKIQYHPPHSEETKRKISLKNKGRFPTEETRRKLSEYQRNRPPMSMESRRKLSLAKMGNKGRLGIPLTPEQIERLRRANIGRKVSLESRIKMSIAHATRVKKLRDTSIEKIIQYELTKLGIQFQKQKCFRIREFNHMVDFFVPPNICIECDGDWFHSRLYTWNRKTLAIKRDFIIDAEIEKKGMRVVRLWEYDINNNLNWCMKLILGFINLDKSHPTQV